jgi:hypothetical protein
LMQTVTVEYVFEWRALFEYGIVVTLGAKRVVISEDSVAITTYADHVYEYRKDDGYSVVFDVPPGGVASLGRAFGLVGPDREAVPVWFGGAAPFKSGRSHDVIAAFRATGWEVDVRENQGFLPRLIRRLRS